MISNLISTNIPMPNFVAGERPSANKFNAFFSYLNYKLMFVGNAIGDIHGVNSASIPTNRWSYSYQNGNISNNASESRDIDIISLANLIGPSSNLNPRLINQTDSYLINNEIIPAGTSEYNLKASFGNQVSNIAISNYSKKDTFNSLENANDFYFDSSENTIFFYKKTTEPITVNYSVDTLKRNAFSHNSFSFNVIPDPNTFSAYTKVNNSAYFLSIDLIAGTTNYTISLPTIGAQQSNSFDSLIGGDVKLDLTNPNFNKSILLPKNIVDYYSTADNSEKVIPSNLIVLKNYTNGDIFKDASYYFVDNKTIRVENLNIDPACLISDNFVLITNGTNITASIDDLNVKFAKHSHDGSLGESKVSIKHIADIFSNQDETKKYFPSTAIGMNWMPQYLHRNGWSLDCDNLNDDNVMRGHLVLNQGLAVYFKKPENENEINEAPRIFSFLNSFNIFATEYILNISMTKDINIVSFENLKLQGGTSAKLILNPLSKHINITDTNTTIKHDEEINIVSNNLNYENYSGTNNLNQNFTSGVHTTYTSSTESTSINSDSIKIAKKESVIVNGRSPVEIDKLYYNEGSSADYIVESENNLPPIPRSQIDNRSGKLRSETTKTIIINCIPTSENNTADGDRPKWLIPMGPININNFWTRTFNDDFEKNYRFANEAFGFSSYDLKNLLIFQNQLRDSLTPKIDDSFVLNSTIPWDETTLGYRQTFKFNSDGQKFALVKRGKCLSHMNNGYDPASLNSEVNVNLINADTTDSTHRDHIIPYAKLDAVGANHTDFNTITKATRKNLAIADKYYEADLVYVGVKEESKDKSYNSLTLDDLDTSIEIRYLELKEIQSLIHFFSVSNGGNAWYPEDEYLWNLFNTSGQYFASQHLSSIMRLTKTHWFRESFPIVRINSAKTNIINIDHAHNVDYINNLYYVMCQNRSKHMIQSPYFNSRIGRILSNKFGHNLYRTQLLTAYIDVDHSTLHADTEYKYEVNINSELAALPYAQDPKGVYNYGEFEEKYYNYDPVGDDIPAETYGEGTLTYNLTHNAYRNFYSPNSSRSGKNLNLERSSAREKVVYEGPAVKLIVKDVDHYVVNAIPFGMYQDGSNNMIMDTKERENYDFFSGMNYVQKTYRVGYKNQTKIKKCNSYGSGETSTDYNGVFFYNQTSAGLIDNKYVPNNTPTSNLYIMTNSDKLSDNSGTAFTQQETNEHEFTDSSTTESTIDIQTRRIPAYACLNNIGDLDSLVQNGKTYSTNLSWDSVFLTNTSNLNIKVKVKEEYILDYDSINNQIETLFNDNIDELTSNSRKDELTIFLGTFGSININPKGLKKVKVAYIETSNTLFYKETTHSKKTEYSDYDSDPKQCVQERGGADGVWFKNNENIIDDDNIWWDLKGGSDSWLYRDRFGRNKFGMSTVFEKIRAGYARVYFGNLKEENPYQNSYLLFVQAYNNEDIFGA